MAANAGTRNDRGVLIVGAIVSAVATLWFSPVGAALFVITLIYAVPRARTHPVVVAVVVAATVVSVLAALGFFFLSNFGGPLEGPPPAPKPPPN